MEAFISLGLLIGLAAGTLVPAALVLRGPVREDTVTSDETDTAVVEARETHYAAEHSHDINLPL